MPVAAAITKLSPWTTIATNVALTGTLAQIGVAFCVATFANATVDIRYTANGGGGTGSPGIAIDLSRDPATVDPTGITDWTPLLILGGATFALGVITAYTEQVRPLAAAGVATTFDTRWPDVIDVSCHFWLRVRMLDVDAALPGTVTIRCGGSV